MCAFSATLLICAVNAQAGGGPQNVLIVVNDQSLESLELGRYYQEIRGIPERNICHISVSPCVQGFPNSYSISTNTFATQVRDPILQHIQNNGLTNQIDYIVFSRDIPYKVNDYNGITAAMFYGYKSSPLSPLDANTSNGYSFAETAFNRKDTTNDYYLCMMLTSWTLDEAKSLASRGATADETFPTGTVYLVKTDDIARNIRYLQFDNLDFLYRFTTNFPALEILNTSSISGKTDVIGYLTGSQFVPDLLSNSFLPGGYGDHLTSYGGQLFEGQQMSILDFIKAGACGSYGTVTEPFAIPNKFPNVMSYFWYARGFNLAESYWMSVRNPYNGLFVGEPLASPYTARPLVSISSPSSNQIVSGTVTLSAAASSGAPDQKISQIDLFVDGLFTRTITNVAPAAGNIVSVTVADKTLSYIVKTNNTLYDIVSGLATNITNSNGIPVDAEAHGDRIMLVYTNHGNSGSNITYSAFCSTGFAASLPLYATNLTGNLMESQYPAREGLYCYGNPPDSGDVLRVVITLENGLKTTNEVVATTNDTVDHMMQSLFSAINSNSTLQAANGIMAADYASFGDVEFWLEARQAGPQGYKIRVQFDIVSAWPVSGLKTTAAFSDNMDDNLDVLTARGNVLVSCGLTNLPGSCQFDTTQYPNGPHALHVIAYDGSAIRSQGYAELPVVVSNGSLACALMTPTNNQSFRLGDTVSSTATVSGIAGSVTQVAFYIEGKLLAVTTNAPYTSLWNTLTYGVGSVGVQAQAWDNAGNSAVSSVTRINVLSTNDADHDQLADDWERRYFASTYTYSGTDDPDGDKFSNVKEYIANTDPTNSTSYFTILGLSRDSATDYMLLTFVSSTARQYMVETREVDLTHTNAWQPAFDSPRWGDPGAYFWFDAGDTNRSLPLQATNRFYRVKALLP